MKTRLFVGKILGKKIIKKEKELMLEDGKSDRIDYGKKG
jgi:hypothetical protein